MLGAQGGDIMYGVRQTLGLALGRTRSRASLDGGRPAVGLQANRRAPRTHGRVSSFRTAATTGWPGIWTGGMWQWGHRGVPRSYGPWMPPTHHLADYRAAVEQWTEERLRPYLTTVSLLPERSARSKELNDPVWGTLLLLPHEVVVLDSPLLQRLRRIRQLGVAHLVYPAAQHMRLEHSIGVTHQVQRLVDSINSHPIGNGQAPEIGDDLRHLLRMAALCHDIGHGLMSHVVENALRTDKDIVRLLVAAQTDLDRSELPQLSELAAYCMLGSPSFAELLRQAFRLGGVVSPADMQANMQSLVIGRPVSEEYPLLHELVTGPFDADKLDYLPRDAAMCGVPVVTDVTRLVQKVRAVRLPAERLPDPLKRVLPAGHGAVVTGLARSGASTLDELALGRSLMFDKIYRHQKVRAAEAMVGGIIEQVGRLLCLDPAMLPLQLDDDQALRLTPEAVEARAGRALTPDERIRTEVAAHLARELYDRRLHVRAFAYAQKMPQDPYRNDQDQRHAVETFVRTTAEEPDRSVFRKRVSDLAEQVLELTRRGAELAALPGGTLEPYLWIDPPAGKPGDSQPLTGRAQLIDERGDLMQAGQANAETQGWADAYVTTRHIGYVFAPRQFATAVHLAAEAASRRWHGVRVAPSMLSYSKRDPAEVATVRRQLAASGFYDGPLRELRPLAPALAVQAARWWRWWRWWRW